MLFDLSPENWTAVNENFPVGLAVRQPLGTGDEAVPVQRAADRVHSAPGGGAQGRRLVADLVSVAQEVWWSDEVGDEAAKVAGGGECPPEETCGGPPARQGHAEGCRHNKALEPARAR
jgi:hypothetical protein